MLPQKISRFFLALSAGLLLSSGLLIGSGLTSTVLADNDLTYQNGVRLFNSADYKNALNYFRAAEKEAPYDYRPIYYQAMCFSRQGQHGAARVAFGTLLQKFPDSDGAELARKALAIPAKGTVTIAPTGLKSMANMAMDELPKEALLKAEDLDGKPVVPVKIGGRDIKVMLDTERPESVVGQDLAVRNKLDLTAIGGRDGKASDDGIYVTNDVIAAGVKRAQMPIYISKKDKEVAVLGNDFLNGYQVSYDKEAATVKLTRVASAANPFGSGMKLFNAGKYKEALPLLRSAATNRPQDPRALYCLAVCLQKAGYLEEAKNKYRAVRKRFSNSEAAFLSYTALEQLDPSFRSEMRALEESQRNNVAMNKMKSEEMFEVPYVVENSRYRVRCYFDNQSMEAYFEPAEGPCIFSVDQIRQVDPSYVNNTSNVKIENTESNPEANTNIQVSTYNFKLKSVRFGKVEAREVPAIASEGRSMRGASFNYNTFQRPILSGFVLKGMRWEIDNTKRVVKVWKPNL